MRSTINFLLLLLISLFLCTSAHAVNPSIINNQANAHCGSCLTTNGTLGALTTIGDQLIAFAVCTGVSSTTITIADVNAGGTNQTWVAQPVSNTYTGNTTTGVVSIWKVASANAIPSADAVTVTSTATCTNLNMFTVEGANIAAVDAGPSGASGLSSGTVTPGFPTELVLGFVAGGDGNANNVAGAGYTLIATSDTGSANPGWEYKVITACANQQAVFASGSGTQYTNILTFEGSTPGSACGGGGVKRLRGAVVSR